MEISNKEYTFYSLAIFFSAYSKLFSRNVIKSFSFLSFFACSFDPRPLELALLFLSKSSSKFLILADNFLISF